MPIQRLTGPEGSDTSGFVVVDLEGAEGADGVVRCAKKILLDGARTMARSRTYSWALLEQRRSGASGAINAVAPHRDEGITAFVEGVAPRVAAGELSLDPGKGLGPADLAGLAAADARGTLRDQPVGHVRLEDHLVALGCVTAAATVLDGLDGRSVAIEGAGSAGPALLDLLGQVGARVVAVATTSGSVVDAGGLDTAALAATWAEHGDALPSAVGSELPPDAWSDTAADVVLVGSRMGMVDHELAERLATEVLVPVGVAPVTAKGLAVATRGGTTVLADFLTLSGPLQAWFADGSADPAAVIDRVRDRSESLTRTSLAHPDGPYLGACAAAEDFLASWQDELPFGRPLA